MPITLTDAEQRFADSPAGKAKLAYARMNHDTAEAHRGAGARPWTDAMEHEAVRKLSAADARTQLYQTTMAMSDTTAVAKAAHDTAYQRMKHDLSNAWRKR